MNRGTMIGDVERELRAAQRECDQRAREEREAREAQREADREDREMAVRRVRAMFSVPAEHRKDVALAYELEQVQRQLRRTSC